MAILITKPGTLIKTLPLFIIFIFQSALTYSTGEESFEYAESRLKQVHFLNDNLKLYDWCFWHNMA